MVKYKEYTGKSCAELDTLTRKSKAVEVRIRYYSHDFSLCQVSNIAGMFLQERCSSQRMQIDTLKHELEAANEKLKVILML